MSTVLVVEDSPSQRECISSQLSWSGLNVIQACDGVEALEQVQNNSPDLVLLDIIMPRLDGYGVCRLIKAHPETQNIPIVFLTCKGQHWTLSWSIKHADAYISKPWQPRELLNTIKRVLLETKNLPKNISAEAWTEYGVSILKMIELHECRANAWIKYAQQMIQLYDYAMAAFQQALDIDPHHTVARQYQARVENQWNRLLEKLEQTKPCNLCRYYYGKDGLICAVHPSGSVEKLCPDWDFR
jgi:twitching motility two-component system response regulator PilH